MKIKVTKAHGKMANKEAFREAWENLEDGTYNVLFQAANRGNGRYKFYFDSTMFCILAAAADQFSLNDKPAQKVEDIHLFMKLMYNPVHMVDPTTGEVFKTPGTTTQMSDSEFISKFHHQIIADFSGPPWLIEFPDYQQWVEMRSNDEWCQFKEQKHNEKRNTTNSIQ